MTPFIKSTALSCNSSGQSGSAIPQRTHLIINSDIIAAINGKSICMKSGEIIRLESCYYKDFLLDGSVIPTL